MKTVVGLCVAVVMVVAAVFVGATEFSLTSAAFESGSKVPMLHSCDGKDISPPLTWMGAPDGTRAFAMIMDDPDAPSRTWVHWVIYNIPAEITSLPMGVPTDGTLQNGAMQGTNSWNRTGYGGPCPPSGSHRYFFKLYALSDYLGLAPGASKREVLKAMEGKVLGQTELMGYFR